MMKLKKLVHMFLMLLARIKDGPNIKPLSDKEIAEFED